MWVTNRSAVRCGEWDPTQVSIISWCEGGGPDRDRTDDLLDANQALSQLSYGPNVTVRHPSGGGRFQSIATLSRCSHSPLGSRRLDLLDANQALSQLSYGPEYSRPSTLVKDLLERL